MANLSVDPDYLKELAKYQDQAAVKSGSGATATNEITKNIWVTHGAISAHSNNAADRCVAKRRAAGAAMAKASADLAAKLRTAGLTYEGVDDKLSGNFNKQMLDC